MTPGLFPPLLLPAGLTTLFCGLLLVVGRATALSQVMERWVNKIAMLEQKKQHYEEILRRELDGLDDEFETLRLLSQELSVRATGLRFRKAA